MWFYFDLYSLHMEWFWNGRPVFPLPLLALFLLLLLLCLVYVAQCFFCLTYLVLSCPALRIFSCHNKAKNGGAAILRNKFSLTTITTHHHRRNHLLLHSASSTSTQSGGINVATPTTPSSIWGSHSATSRPNSVGHHTPRTRLVQRYRPEPVTVEAMPFIAVGARYCTSTSVYLNRNCL